MTSGQSDSLKRLKFGYIPYQPGAASPGDRRRFPLVATKLGLDWSIYDPSERYDVLYVTSNADLTEMRRYPSTGTKIVFEMVDSYLGVPDWNPKAIVRGVGKWLLRRHRHLEPIYRLTLAGMCQRADLVLCSMPEQKAQMLPWNSNVHDILDFHEELGDVPHCAPPLGNRKLDIFWEGVALSAFQFRCVSAVLQDLNLTIPLRLHLLTDLKYKPINAPLPPCDTRKTLAKILGNLEFHLYEWNTVAVRALASQCDLGLIPLSLGQAMFGSKPENKLLIMWRLGLPVVTSATPAYSRTMQAYGGPNWACQTESDWHTALGEAFTSQELRKSASQQGKNYAETLFGSEALLERWKTALATLL